MDFSETYVAKKTLLDTKRWGGGDHKGIVYEFSLCVSLYN